MKPKLFYIQDFQLRMLFRKGLYRVIWFAIKAKFGYISVTKYDFNGMRMSVGTGKPLDDLWNAGYKVAFGGWILFEPIILYFNPNYDKTLEGNI